MTEPAAKRAKLDPEQIDNRLQQELEFVQLLANPRYINFLAQRKWFEKPGFVNYLKYLQYWKQRPYVTIITYPQCLYFLDLLQDPKFRTEIAKVDVAEYIAEQQYNAWQFSARKQKYLADKVKEEQDQDLTIGEHQEETTNGAKEAGDAPVVTSDDAKVE
eukprot:Clim_evm69s146 gene=Clim_evmTU69s146